MIDKDNDISMVRQCELLNIHRSGLYYQPKSESEENLLIMRLMDELYLEAPFYGARRVRNWLQERGFVIAKSRVKRLMDLMGWQTLFPKKNTSKRNKEHAVYPYLLKGLDINRCNQVWAIDITYVPMRKGFMYLCAVIDVHTRFVLNWSVSNNMTSEWCRSIVEEAIGWYGAPGIINSDQGSQFTSQEYISLLKENNIAISMDGKGRAIDNIFIERLWRTVKYECVYLHAFHDGVELYQGLKKYFSFYNYNRGHQSHNYKTPASIYKLAA
jgi:putative transposase